MRMLYSRTQCPKVAGGKASLQTTSFPMRSTSPERRSPCRDAVGSDYRGLRPREHYSYCVRRPAAAGCTVTGLTMAGLNSRPLRQSCERASEKRLIECRSFKNSK